MNQKVLFRGQNSNLYDGGKYFRESYGLGDVLLQARIQRIFFNEIPIILGIGVKLSNGKINMTDEFGERISDNLQVGTGTIDPILSIYSSKDIKKEILNGVDKGYKFVIGMKFKAKIVEVEPLTGSIIVKFHDDTTRDSKNRKIKNKYKRKNKFS